MPSDSDNPPEAAALGIVPPNQRRSVGACIRRGLLWVNGPVLAIMVAAYALPLSGGFIPAHIAVSGGVREALPYLAIGYIIFCPPGIAWIWWSATVSKWRIWALQHVSDWPALEARAVGAGIIWHRGHFFERTEIKSRAQRKLECALIAYRDEYG